MEPLPADDSSETHRLLALTAGGDGKGLGALLTRHERRLRRIVAFRLDPRLRGRVDPSDVIQEVYLAASKRIAGYLDEPRVPLFLWLRGITTKKLLEIHRFHLATPMRDARKEDPRNQGAFQEATSAAIAAKLFGREPRPSEAAMQAEAKIRVRTVLDGMDAIDREVLALRHFEQLTNIEAAAVLGIKELAAAKRYLRALERLREMLSQMPDAFDF